MQKFSDLYDFIDLAKANRKYPENTANNLKSALKIFEKELNAYELKSIGMVEESIEEIFRSVTIANKGKSILSLNTYKARLLKVINDYKKYGVEPGKIQGWSVKIKKSTGVLVNKDKPDKENITVSKFIQATVENMHKIELSLRNNIKATIIVPRNITQKEAKAIKDIINTLVFLACT